MIIHGYTVKRSKRGYTLKHASGAATTCATLKDAIDIIKRQLAHNANCVKLIKQLSQE